MKPPEVKQGQRIDKSFFDDIFNRILNVLKGGKGISVKRAGSQIVIEQTDNPIIPIGGTTFHTADTKANLPSVSAPALGYATSTGRYYVRVGSEWWSITHVENF